jgi:RNA polymerase sigma factor (sigma-70 family)
LAQRRVLSDEVNSLTDQHLLREYAERRSEAAFGEVVARHVDFVYSAAMRMVRDPHLAQDVTQNVFVALAQNARDLTDRPILAGWLHRTARNFSGKAVRSELRRRARERQAATMNDLVSTEPDALWDDVAPELDAALDELSDPDRDAVLLRYFDRKSAREMAQALGTSEEAAQKRVSRAVERLREVFAQRGIAVGASGLVLLISANGVQAAPAGLVLSISTIAALAGTTSAATATATSAAKALTMTTLQKVLITATITAAVGTAIYEARQTSALRAQVRTLQQQQGSLAGQNEQLQRDRDDALKRLEIFLARPAPQLPAPRMQVAALPTENLQPTNLYARLKGERPKLTRQQVTAYLEANRRSASSLLAAYRTTGDPALLAEAMEKYPDDPQVAFEAAFRKSAPPEQRQHWLDVLKKSAPENALGNYLSALDYFKLGQSDRAVEELIAASGKQQFQDYSLARGQDDEEAYLAAGNTPAEAKALAASQLLLPQLAELKQLSGVMIDLAKSYQQAGNSASAEAVLQMAANLGQRFNGSPGEPLISRLVGLAIERNAFRAMDPNSPYPGTGQTAQERVNELARQSAALKDLAQQFETVGERMSDADWIHYIDRLRSFGELAATQWVLGKYGSN